MIFATISEKDRFLHWIAWGVNKVLSVAIGSPNHDWILRRRHNLDGLLPLGSGGERSMPVSRARELLLSEIRGREPRKIDVTSVRSPDRILGYGFTANNRREFAWFEQCISLAADQYLRIDNLCDLKKVRVESTEKEIENIVCEGIVSQLNTYDVVPRSALRQLIIFAASLCQAVACLSEVRSSLFVVANDHSPSPVAFSVAARYFGMKLVYVQHAEVSPIFPRLDFDYSILRNIRSFETYSKIGPVSGRVAVIARDDDAIDPLILQQKRDLLRRHTPTAVTIYPSAVLDETRLGLLISRLHANSAVDRIRVKMHPNSDSSISHLEPQCEIVHDVPCEPHVAITGTSSVAIDLLKAGCLVFQDDKLDDLSGDYYGFVREGLVQQLVENDLGIRFWAEAATFDEKIGQILADFIPNITTQDNFLGTLASDSFVKSILYPEIVRDAEVVESHRRLWFISDLIKDASSVWRLCADSVTYATNEWQLSTVSHAMKVVPHESFLQQQIGRPNHCRSVTELWCLDISLESVALPPALATEVESFVRSLDASPVVVEWAKEAAARLLARGGGMQ